MKTSYLPVGLPAPLADRQGPTAPFWKGLQDGALRIQFCRACNAVQWGPDYICNACHSLDLDWKPVEPEGRIYSWTRVWQAAQPVLEGSVPYVVVLVELVSAQGVRLVGNLLGEPLQPVEIGMPVVGVFESHEEAGTSYTLLQWRKMDGDWRC
ncbi:MAG: OB-fold domain-containing protein [Hyphomicrobiales bacterium]|nr:OB-fold domain-containing protein [Hyphomicrobiales bacterium]